jgi:hypothetical protein
MADVEAAVGVAVVVEEAVVGAIVVSRQPPLRLVISVVLVKTRRRMRNKQLIML